MFVRKLLAAAIGLLAVAWIAGPSTSQYAFAAARPGGPLAPESGAYWGMTTNYAAGLAALEKCDAVVKSPGISRYRPEVARLTERGVPVAGGLGLWLQEADPRRVLLITGTKGKSTTASIAGHLLNGLGGRTLVGGNIGQPPYDPEVAAQDWVYWVIEVSSYQATDLPGSTPVVRSAKSYTSVYLNYM